MIHFLYIYMSLYCLAFFIRKTITAHVICCNVVSRITSYNVCYTKLLRLWARLASKVELLLFADAADMHPEIIALDPKTNRSGYYWHLYLQGVAEGQLYGYRLDGPWRPAAGARFDPDKVLLDPYGRQVVLGTGYA